MRAQPPGNAEPASPTATGYQGLSGWIVFGEGAKTRRCLASREDMGLYAILR